MEVVRYTEEMEYSSFTLTVIHSRSKHWKYFDGHWIGQAVENLRNKTWMKPNYLCFKRYMKWRKILHMLTKTLL